jgi:cyclopropane-fatty-acyl-phospholipid synthase
MPRSNKGAPEPTRDQGVTTNSDQDNEPSPSAPPRTGASSAAIRRHYDLSDEFFQLWLDPLMIYSCALYDGTADLATAQILKLDHHIEAAGASGVGRVLDIGCGWGGLLNRLVAHAGVRQAVGLTLSRSQAAWARQRAQPGIEVREESWRDHRPAKPYDAIISIGAFEHFVHPGIDKAAKLTAYRAFFEWCAQSLVPGGRLSLQTIAFTQDPASDIRQRMDFIADSIFPESELPCIWEPITAAEGPFELVALRNDGDHYFLTLRQWERNLVARRPEASALVGEEAFENVRQYLRISAAAYRYHRLSLLRMSFVRTP